MLSKSDQLRTLEILGRNAAPAVLAKLEELRREVQGGELVIVLDPAMPMGIVFVPKGMIH